MKHAIMRAYLPTRLFRKEEKENRNLPSREDSNSMEKMENKLLLASFNLKSTK